MLFIPAFPTALRIHYSENTSSCKQSEAAAHSVQQNARNRPYREMTKGHVDLSQEVVSCLLGRERRVNVSI